MKFAGITGVLLIGLTFPMPLEAQEIRLVRALSGPSGKVVGPDFVLDETRTRFVYPQDRFLTVYFEWEFVAGDHELVATWVRPDGQVAAVSPAVRIKTESKEIKSYWIFEIAPTLPTGAWTASVRINGQPAGAHSFEIAGTSATGGRVTIDHVFKTYGPSIVRIHRQDEGGRPLDSSSGFVIARNAIVTSFQSIDAADRVVAEFSDGRRTPVTDVWAVSRAADWAILKVDTGAAAAIPRTDGQSVPVGSRVVGFDDDSGTRVLAGVDVGAVSAAPAQAPRIRFSPALTWAALGSPLIDEYGKVIGVVGGSTTPGYSPGRRVVISGSLRQASGVAAATVITAVPSALPAASRSFEDLKKSGVLTTPLSPMPEFVYGGTTVQLPKEAGNRSITPTSEFSISRDPTVHVYSYWTKRSRLSRGEVSVAVFDIDNREVGTIPPRRITLRDQDQRIAASWPVKGMPPGSYRIDVRWDGKPVWRTYIRVVE